MKNIQNLCSLENAQQEPEEQNFLSHEVDEKLSKLTTTSLILNWSHHAEIDSKLNLTRTLIQFVYLS
jgi:hypothetical protein